MRTAGAAFLAALLFAVPAWSDTLAPGRPAGVKQAQIGSTYVYAGAATGIFVGVLLAISNITTIGTAGIVIAVANNNGNTTASPSTTTAP